MITWLIRKILARIERDINHYKTLRMRDLRIAYILDDNSRYADSQEYYERAEICFIQAQRESRLYNKLARFIGEQTIKAV